MWNARSESAAPRSIGPRSWVVRDAVALHLAAAVVLALTGCGTAATGGADSATVRPAETTEADGPPCPEDLPIGDDPSGHGFGVERAADQLPRILEPQAAWVCRYDAFDRDAAPSGGTVYGWRLAGDAEPVAPGDLPALQGALDDLSIPGPERACTADLGPRWMIVYTHEGGLTGVVVDDYGCRSVRLTDDPHTTPPGADGQDRAVAGVVQGGAAILDVLGLGRAD